jgi:MFS family permease
MTPTPRAPVALLSLTVAAAALGYFADIFDIVLFTMVMTPSLKGLGLNPTIHGPALLDWQMIGMLAGGLIWGVIGDIAGRRAAMFASIITYSLANFLNAGVGLLPLGDTYSQYAVARALSGFGLAGELGAAIALVSESVARDRRGLATALVSALGICGAVGAFAVSHLCDWRTAYVVGGVLGFVVLALRLRVFESGMFDHAVASHVRRGDPRVLLRTAWKPLVLCVLVGLPLWLVVGKLVAGAKTVGLQLGTEGIDQAQCMLWCYVGLVVGDLGSGLLSQWLRSRRKAVAIALALTLVLSWGYLLQRQPTQIAMNWWSLALGLGCGYWALFVTLGAEQFATNIRATAATLIPNLVRGAVPLWTLSLTGLSGAFSAVASLQILVTVVIATALLAAWLLPESFAQDLDYTVE